MSLALQSPVLADIQQVVCHKRQRIKLFDNGCRAGIPGNWTPAVSPEQPGNARQIRPLLTRPDNPFKRGFALASHGSIREGLNAVSPVS